jgi:anti-sigma B factor antagonist
LTAGALPILGGVSATLAVNRLDIGPTAVLAVEGELDIAQTPTFGLSINEALRAGPPCLVIDLCEVAFLDSTGLAVLLNARRRTRRQGTKLKLVCDVESTLRLLRLTRLDRDFEVYPTLDEALAECPSSAVETG